MQTIHIHAPMACTLLAVATQSGETVRAGQLLLVLEAMKMEHEIHAPQDGRITEVLASAGELVQEGDLLLSLVPQTMASAPAESPATATAVNRHDLQALRARLALTEDASRPQAVAKRHALGLRSARENIADLCDAGSFSEYGALAVAAQASRRSVDDLQRNTPADGLVCGTAAINGQACAVLAYDATVLAGTQGMRNHQKTDRLLGVALQHRLPLVLFAEGGGGRPGDTDMPIVAGLHVTTFASHARLSGQVPMVGIAAGRCFAGNAALLGCCDAIIATEASNIGMGGPAMVEGGGLGVFAPEQIGPSEVQARNGVIDVLVRDEAQAVAAAKQYLGYFQGSVLDWTCGPPEALRQALPDSRTRSYDMRALMQQLADTGSLLELRPGFGPSVLTALARIEGRPVGLLASNPAHLGGAIDADAADKTARFMRLCNTHGLPLVSLIDTPGFMVGPETEATAQVRHVSRIFVAAAHLRVPLLALVIRKGYGLGAMALAGGGFHAPLATAAWPSAEFGAMGLEGAVRLGYRKELEAQAEGPAREALFQRLLQQQIANGSALNMATTLEIDAVVDPADSRRWLSQGLAAGKIGQLLPGGIDTW